jgi:hypothetical protein
MISNEIYPPDIHILDEQTIIVTGSVREVPQSGHIAYQAMRKSTEGGERLLSKPLNIANYTDIYFRGIDFYGSTGIAVGTSGYIARTTDA